MPSDIPTDVPHAHEAPPRRRRGRVWFGLLGHALLLAAWVGLLGPGCVEALTGRWRAEIADPTPPRAEAHLAGLRAHLAAPFDGYDTAQVLHEPFAVIALSHMAYGLMNLARAEPDRRAEFAGPIREITRRALHPQTSPYGRSPAKVDALGEHNLYLSHLNLILGVRRHITQETDLDALHTRISKHLRQRSLADGDWHAHSYPPPERLASRPGAYKWPADQAALLASLFLYDMTRGSKLSARPIRGWLRALQSPQLWAKRWELPRSAVDPEVSYARWPRGCAMSWTILYMTQFAPARAAELYDSYRHHYGDDVLGWGGFREWPPGVSRSWDVDSGPVFFGVGMAATGLGLGPARLMRDHRQHALIERAASTFGVPTAWGPRRWHLSAPLLGEAILFSGRTARVWFGPQPPRDRYPEAPPWPWGPALTLAMWVALSMISVRGLWRRVRALRAPDPAPEASS